VKKSHFESLVARVDCLVLLCASSRRSTCLFLNPHFFRLAAPRHAGFNVLLPRPPTPTPNPPIATFTPKALPARGPRPVVPGYLCYRTPRPFSPYRCTHISQHPPTGGTLWQDLPTSTGRRCVEEGRRKCVCEVCEAKVGRQAALASDGVFRTRSTNASVSHQPTKRGATGPDRSRREQSAGVMEASGRVGPMPTATSSQHTPHLARRRPHHKPFPLAVPLVEKPDNDGRR
jgi:hypothetical protein